MKEKINDEWNRPDDICVNADEYDKKCINLDLYEQAIGWIKEALENEDYEEIKRVLEGLDEELN